MKTPTSKPAARHLLSRATDGHTSFCSFTCDETGSVRVVAYGTHTAYTNDQTVSREEARDAWRALIAQGYAVAA